MFIRIRVHQHLAYMRDNPLIASLHISFAKLLFNPLLLLSLSPSLSAGFMGGSYIALTGNLPGLVSSVAATSPILLFPLKFAVAYTLLYHYLGGVRHIVWDHSKLGPMADKKSMLELPAVEMSSKILFVGAGVLSFVAACM